MSLRSRTIVLLLLLAPFLCFTGIDSEGVAGTDLPSINVTLKPGGVASGTPGHPDVLTVLSGLSVKSGESFLQVPIVIASVRAAVYEDGDVVATDAAGPLPLKMTEDSSGSPGFFQWRLFSAARPSQGDIALSYRAPIAPAMSPRRPGPSYDLRG